MKSNRIACFCWSGNIIVLYQQIYYLLVRRCSGRVRITLCRHSAAAEQLDSETRVMGLEQHLLIYSWTSSSALKWLNSPQTRAYLFTR